MTKPFSPEEASESKETNIPDIVFQVVNKLLSARYGKSIEITQKEVIEGILAASFETATREMIFAENWLDFEPAYRKQGWRVEYDKPGYNESYGASWTFKPKS